MENAHTRRMLLVLWDCFLCAASFAFSLIFTSATWSTLSGILALKGWRYLPVILAIHLAVFSLGGTYRILWRMSGIGDALRLILLEVSTCIIMLMIATFTTWKLSRSGIVLTAALTILTALSSRFFWQLLKSGRLQPHTKLETGMVMVVGAGEAGVFAINKLLSNVKYHAKSIILVDDASEKQGAWIQNVPVRGMIKDIPDLVSRYKIQEILIAIPSIYGKKYTDLVTMCNETDCRVRVLTTTINEANKKTIEGQQRLLFRELNTSDFLSREEVKLDTASISGYLTGKTVLVTGGGGSIGSELCRQVMRFSPKALYIYDICENNAYELLSDLRRLYGQDTRIQVLIGSIRDTVRLNDVFNQVRPNVVFHAAAHKHVSLMEHSPGEAIKNNVIGTQNVLEIACSSGVERFVLLSTDKAVNPTNVMGATKRVCEMLVQLYASRTKMKCMAVRFGNVLGSSGSVIPLFERQIRAGGPVTITHPEITRYFMTIPEAAQLVLQAGGLADNGGIYVLDMGEPVKISDLAEKMVRFYGYVPGKDIQIICTGLRVGEKMFEELLTDSEKDSIQRTAHSKISIAPPIPFDEATLFRQIDLLKSAALQNVEVVRGLLREIVDTYHPVEEEQGAVAI